MRVLVGIVLIYVFVSLIFGGSGTVENTDYSDNIVFVENSAYKYVGADGHQIKLINNPNATNPTYDQLCDFIDTDCTDDIKYNESSFACADYAETVHNNAETAGIKCAWVSIDFTQGQGHACNAFNTTDKGVVFIDCTEADKKVNISVGNHYIPERISKSNTEYMPIGIVSDCKIFW